MLAGLFASWCKAFLLQKMARKVAYMHFPGHFRLFKLDAPRLY